MSVRCKRPGLLRLILLTLAAVDAAVGGYALATPQAFYRDVLGLQQLGPYDEHLIRDIGGLYLGFGVLFAWAAWTLSRHLVRAACGAFIAVQAEHLVYHATRLAPLGLGAATAEVVGLAAFVALPGSAWVLARPGGT